MTRPRHPHLLAPALALAALLALPSLTSGQTAPPQGAQPLASPLTFTASVQDGAGNPIRDLSPAEVVVQVGGQAAVVESVAPASPWQVVVYFDGPTSSAEAFVRAAQALGAQAERLAGLGTVEVVLAAPFPEEFWEPTREVEDLAFAFEDLEREVTAAGELAALRRGRGGEVDAASLRQEEALLDQSRALLLEQLALSSGPGQGGQAGSAARAVILVSDGLGSAESTAEMGRALASQGWTVLTLSPNGSGSSGAPSLSALTEATGGRSIASPGDLAGALGDLAGRVAIRARLSAPAGGAALADTPFPLQVLVSRSIASVTAAPRWASAVTPAAVAAARARRLLEEPGAGGGPLGLRAVIGQRPSPAGAGGPRELQVEALLDTSRLPTAGAPTLRATVVVGLLDQPPLVLHDLQTPGDLSQAGGWLYRRLLAVEGEIQGVSVTVEDLGSGLWGASPAVFSTQPLAPPQPRIVVSDAGTGPAPGAPDASPGVPPSYPAPGTPTPGPATPQDRARDWAAQVSGRAAPSSLPPSAGERQVILLLPPDERSVSGRTRFETLVTSEAVDRVVFLVDGVEADSDDRSPFTAVLDLGPSAQPTVVEVVAYTDGNIPMGRDRLQLNRRRQPFTVTLTGVDRVAAGSSGAGGPAIDITAEVLVPPEERLDRVELYLNEELVTPLAGPPYRGRVPLEGPVGDTDYVRVVAFLADGTSLEDVRLLGDTTPMERIEVNLVELFVVVTDRDGAPVRDLGAGDFVIEVDGEERPVERFQLADDVPLTLGVAVDTSESMWPLMIDTQQAAARFLASTLIDGDQAFLVAFSNQPLLVQPPTPQVPELLRRFSQLQAGGATALYDALVFSLLQFGELPGRRAVVLLTDGDDYGSRFGTREVIRYGRKLGVPIYGLSLAGLYEERAARRKGDLEAIARQTGGRTFYITGVDQLNGTYRQIEDELRSQYILAFGTEEPLTDAELDDLEVEVRGRRGLTVRTVIGQQ